MDSKKPSEESPEIEPKGPKTAQELQEIQSFYFKIKQSSEEADENADSKKQKKEKESSGAYKEGSSESPRKSRKKSPDSKKKRSCMSPPKQEHKDPKVKDTEELEDLWPITTKTSPNTKKICGEGKYKSKICSSPEPEEDLYKEKKVLSPKRKSSKNRIPRDSIEIAKHEYHFKEHTTELETVPEGKKKTKQKADESEDEDDTKSRSKSLVSFAPGRGEEIKPKADDTTMKENKSPRSRKERSPEKKKKQTVSDSSESSDDEILNTKKRKQKVRVSESPTARKESSPEKKTKESKKGKKSGSKEKKNALRESSTSSTDLEEQEATVNRKGNKEPASHVCHKTTPTKKPCPNDPSPPPKGKICDKEEEEEVPVPEKMTCLIPKKVCCDKEKEDAKNDKNKSKKSKEKEEAKKDKDKSKKSKGKAEKIKIDDAIGKGDQEKIIVKKSKHSKKNIAQKSKRCKGSKATLNTKKSKVEKSGKDYVSETPSKASGIGEKKKSNKCVKNKTSEMKTLKIKKSKLMKESKHVCKKPPKPPPPKDPCCPKPPAPELPVEDEEVWVEMPDEPKVCRRESLLKIKGHKFKVCCEKRPSLSCLCDAPPKPQPLKPKKDPRNVCCNPELEAELKQEEERRKEMERIKKEKKAKKKKRICGQEAEQKKICCDEKTGLKIEPPKPPKPKPPPKVCCEKPKRLMRLKDKLALDAENKKKELQAKEIKEADIQVLQEKETEIKDHEQKDMTDLEKQGLQKTKDQESIQKEGEDKARRETKEKEMVDEQQNEVDKIKTERHSDIQDHVKTERIHSYQKEETKLKEFTEAVDQVQDIIMKTGEEQKRQSIKSDKIKLTSFLKDGDAATELQKIETKLEDVLPQTQDKIHLTEDDGRNHVLMTDSERKDEVEGPKEKDYEDFTKQRLSKDAAEALKSRLEEERQSAYTTKSEKLRESNEADKIDMVNELRAAPERFKHERHSSEIHETEPKVKHSLLTQNMDELEDLKRKRTSYGLSKDSTQSKPKHNLRVSEMKSEDESTAFDSRLPSEDTEKDVCCKVKYVPYPEPPPVCKCDEYGEEDEESRKSSRKSTITSLKTLKTKMKVISQNEKRKSSDTTFKRDSSATRKSEAMSYASSRKDSSATRKSGDVSPERRRSSRASKILDALSPKGKRRSSTATAMTESAISPEKDNVGSKVTDEKAPKVAEPTPVIVPVPEGVPLVATAPIKEQIKEKEKPKLPEKTKEDIKPKQAEKPKPVEKSKLSEKLKPVEKRKSAEKLKIIDKLKKAQKSKTEIKPKSTERQKLIEKEKSSKPTSFKSKSEEKLKQIKQKTGEKLKEVKSKTKQSDKKTADKKRDVKPGDSKVKLVSKLKPTGATSKKSKTKTRIKLPKIVSEGKPKLKPKSKSKTKSKGKGGLARFYVKKFGKKKTLEEEIQQYKSDFRGRFRDGKRVIDMILVMKDDGVKSEEKKRIRYFIQALKTGLDLELEEGVMYTNWQLLFVKVHATPACIERYGEAYGIKRYFQETHDPCSPFPDDMFLKLAQLNYEKPQPYSSLERCIIVDKILRHLPYGYPRHEYGLRKLIKSRTILDAFPLHDGPYFFIQSQDIDMANPRQLLYYNWVKSCMCFQPLNLIKQYFGERVGFYFAFAQFYNGYLAWLAFFGITTSAFNGVSFWLYPDEMRIAACDKIKHEFACPLCHDIQKCKYLRMEDFCIQAMINSFLDNKYYATLFFSIIIPLWALLFIVNWTRKEKYWVWKWELRRDEQKSSIRKNYRLAGVFTYERLGKIVRFVITSIIFIIFLGAQLALPYLALFKFFRPIKMIVINPLVNLTTLRHSIYSEYAEFCVIAVCLIGALMATELVFKIVSYYMTSFEGHGTQALHDRSIIGKLFVLTCVSSFSVLIYVAWAKELLYIMPQMGFKLWHLCGPFRSCLDQILIVFMITIVLKQIVLRIVKCIFRELIDCNRRWSSCTLPVWETEYLLKTFTEDFITEKYDALVEQFMLLTLFGVAFPLAPLIAIIINLIEMKCTARVLLLTRRRCLLASSTGIGFWRPLIFFIVCTLGIFNALTITQNTKVVERYTYELMKERLKITSFFSFALTEFKTADFAVSTLDDEATTALMTFSFPPRKCYAPGQPYMKNNTRIWKCRTACISTMQNKVVFFFMYVVMVYALMVIINTYFTYNTSLFARMMIVEDRVKNAMKLDEKRDERRLEPDKLVTYIPCP